MSSKFSLYIFFRNANNCQIRFEYRKPVRVSISQLEKEACIISELEKIWHHYFCFKIGFEYVSSKSRIEKILEFDVESTHFQTLREKRLFTRTRLTSGKSTPSYKLFIFKN